MNWQPTSLLHRSRRRLVGALPRAVRACKPAIRDAIAIGLSRAGLTTPARFARSNLTVVTFHRVLPQALLDKYPLPGLAVTPEQMATIVRELSAHFHCLPLIEAYRAYGGRSFSSKPLMAITLDDGALDNYQYARPVLEECGLRGSFYIPVDSIQEQVAPWHDVLGFDLLVATERLHADFEDPVAPWLVPFGVTTASWRQAGSSRARQGLCEFAVERAKTLSPSDRQRHITELHQALGKPEMPAWAGLMSWDQIRELSDAGHEIGSHTLSHPLLPDCETSKIATEIVESRSRLRTLVGTEIASFCYPNGSYDDRCIEQARVAGYECSVTTRWGRNDPGTPAHELRRCDMDFQRLANRQGEFSPERLMFRLSGLQPGLR